VTQIGQVQQQNATLVEQSAAGAESLKEQAHRLAQVVGTFRLESGAVAAAQEPATITKNESASTRKAMDGRPARPMTPRRGSAGIASVHSMTGAKRKPA
jgi:methyl-accepting chemotaxis protein